MTAQTLENLAPEVRFALWEVARTVLEMTPAEQYLAKVSTGQVVAHLTGTGHADHLPGAQLIMAACQLANAVEMTAMKDGVA